MSGSCEQIQAQMEWEDRFKDMDEAGLAGAGRYFYDVMTTADHLLPDQLLDKLEGYLITQKMLSQKRFQADTDPFQKDLSQQAARRFELIFEFPDQRWQMIRQYCAEMEQYYVVIGEEKIVARWKMLGQLIDETIKKEE